MKKVIRLGVSACMLALIFGVGFEVHAATRKQRIKQVSFKVSTTAEIDQRVGEETIEVATSGGRYSYEGFETLDAQFTWTETDRPKFKLTFLAEDGYMFDITKESQIDVNGAAYVSSSRGGDGGSELYVTVQFPALANQVKPLTGLYFNNAGLATWNPSSGAGSYELRLFRGGSTVGGTQTVTDTKLDLSGSLTKAGQYLVKVRPVSKGDANSVGSWESSDSISVSEQTAKANREKLEKERSSGTWVGSTPYWSFIQSNGTRVVSEWRYIHGQWYYFKNNGYAAVGWEYIGDKWYYFDSINCHMWKNTVTPDGFELDITGAWVKRN